MEGRIRQERSHSGRRFDLTLPLIDALLRNRKGPERQGNKHGSSRDNIGTEGRLLRKEKTITSKLYFRKILDFQTTSICQESKFRQHRVLLLILHISLIAVGKCQEVINVRMSQLNSRVTFPTITRLCCWWYRKAETDWRSSEGGRDLNSY